MDAETPSKTNPASGKPDASKVTGMDAEAPSKTSPASGKSDDLKAPKQSHPEMKSAFCGFQHPPKPEDVDMARICSEVEEELCEARRRDLPVDARKSLLRKSLLRLESPEGHCFVCWLSRCILSVFDIDVQGFRHTSATYPVLPKGCFFFSISIAAFFLQAPSWQRQTECRSDARLWNRQVWDSDIFKYSDWSVGRHVQSHMYMAIAKQVQCFHKERS